MKKRLFITLGFFLISLAIYLTFAILVAKNGGLELGIDTWAKNLAYDTRGNKGGFVNILFRILTETGNTYFIIVLVISGLIYTRFDRRWICFGVGILLEFALNTIFKNIYQRERPDQAMRWMYESSTSFPSGHSATAGMVYSYIIYNFLTSKDKKAVKITAIAISLSLIVLVPASRIILGMHYLSDCMAGLSLGFMVSAAMMALTEVFTYYNILGQGVIHFKKREEKSKEE